MTEKTGVARLRAAINNQASAGEACFSLTMGEARALCAEIDDELLEICGSAEREIVRYAWVYGVPAPKDADGEVVPLNTKELYTDDGEMICVNSIRFDGCSWDVRNSSSGVLYPINMLHRTKRDSWEKLEEDVEQFEDGGTACEYFGSELTSCNECKSPCSIGANCRNSVARDVLRRAKALAGRGED